MVWGRWFSHATHALGVNVKPFHLSKKKLDFKPLDFATVRPPKKAAFVTVEGCNIWDVK